MRTAIILHGMPSEEEYFDLSGLKPTESHWLLWLKQELLRRGIKAETPAFPEPYKPVYEKWKEEFEKYPLDQETDLIGHSCGAGFLVRWLSENKMKVGKVILVAPYLDPDNDHMPEFFEFTMDKDLAERTNGITIFLSLDDDSDIIESTRKIKEGIKNIEIQEFHDKGHFTSGDMKTNEFPELLEAIISNKKI